MVDSAVDVVQRPLNIGEVICLRGSSAQHIRNGLSGQYDKVP